MKSFAEFLGIGLLGISLAGCATSHAGREAKVYEDQQVALIKRGETTEAQLVNWFGPADSRSVGADGRMVLSWSFGTPTATGRSHTGMLQVNLGPDGKVDAYSARRGPR